jgi:predicted PurR-regulated permease PerM
MVRGFDEDRGRLAWWGFGFALGAAVLYIFYRFVGTFVFGVFLYYATRPVYKRVRYRIERRSLAAAASLTLFLLPSLLLASYTLAIAYGELQKFAGQAGELARSGEFDEYESLIEPYVAASQLITQPEELLAGGGVDVVGDIVLTSITYLGTLAIFALHLFVIVAIAFYLLRDDQRLVKWFTTRFADDRGVLDEYLTVVDKDFNNIFFGNILNAVLTGTIGAIVYTLLNLMSPAGSGIPYAALVGLLTGTASLVPVVGMKLVYVPVAIYLFALPVLNQQPETTWFPITFAAVSFVVVDTIPDLVLRPYVSGRSLHIGALMLAYILGPLLFGWYGLFLAPMLLVLVVHFVRIVMPELIGGEPLKPYAVDPTYLAGDVVDNPTTRQATESRAPTDDESVTADESVTDAATVGAAAGEATGDLGEDEGATPEDVPAEPATPDSAADAGDGEAANGESEDVGDEPESTAGNGHDDGAGSVDDASEDEAGGDAGGEGAPDSDGDDAPGESVDGDGESEDGGGEAEESEDAGGGDDEVEGAGGEEASGPQSDEPADS